MVKYKLIAGLGNPGEKYTFTKHNLGFRVADELARRWGCSWKPWKSQALVASPEDPGRALLFKPQTYMNNSGQPLSNYLGYHNILPGEIIVILDDFSLPLGKLRLRKSGSAGGHNGLSSVIVHCGTDAIARLRLGIGPVAEEAATADFVLSAFAHAEQDAVSAMVDKAATVVELALEQGMDKAISKITP